MDCATVADGKLDECIELPGQQIEMSGLLSKVRTDPFSFSFLIAITAIVLLGCGCAKPSLDDELIGASGAGDLSEIKRTLALGANVNSKSHSLDGSTPLIWAVRENHADAVEALLAEGADPNVQNGHGKTALFYAFSVDRDTSRVIGTLIAAGATTGDCKELFLGLNKTNVNRIAFENAAEMKGSRR